MGNGDSTLKFGDTRIMALFQALCMFMLLPRGFRNAICANMLRNFWDCRLKRTPEAE